MTLPKIPALLDGMVADLEAAIDQRGLDRQRLALVGIHTGGVWIADALHRRLALPTPQGTLDIGFWRDDFGHQGLPEGIRTSHLPFDVEERDLVLVDDVVMSGRTIRAALNELFDYGRPRRVLLAALISLPGRELPIQPDICGARLELAAGDRVKLSGPDPLALSLVSRSQESR
ncbi:pyrimidine operon attenuation protein / uracil phosphoribosyltransferase [Modicisalibacter ilicicola DSM 19980]|uniref:Pyrimidine operon attenuation protein / uracil phosphoribosyltransferase n=1 Tax=Modicisalibacter ilicicola DSM 19980 TaxID=1121942 RepID=A0A1M4VNU0_9GAMM|nr:bifunctional pyr operon transcriptional regulator/uracil phosphoribosyltransferase PyrR [Halomonas ilicicola]SHE70771.1 pyrimidine operon attenuation protein / uracil phosphoribosyltransferase [Halomonas ilicicola DSM 19980]